MGIKTTLSKIEKFSTANRSFVDRLNSYDSVADLIELLKNDKDKQLNPGILDSLLKGTRRKLGYDYYRSFVEAKIAEMFPAQKAKIGIKYTADKHFLYMKYVLADYLSNSSDYSKQNFSDIDDKGFEKIELKFTEFLNPGSPNAAPPKFSASWDKLLDILAGEDVKAGQKDIEDTIKKSLSDARVENSEGVSFESFLSGADEAKKKIFQRNLQQSILFGAKEYFANYRDSIRFYELFPNTPSRNILGKQSGLYNSVNLTLAGDANKCLPYGGRILPLNFAFGTIMNSLKTHPWAWCFFRDASVNLRENIQFFKMIYRTKKDDDGNPVTKQYEAPLTLLLPKVLREGETEDDPDPLKIVSTGETGSSKVDTKCLPRAGLGDETNVKVVSLSVDFKGTTPTTAQNDVNVTLVLEIPRISSLKTKFGDTLKDKKGNDILDDDGKPIEYEWSIIDFITYYGNTDSRTEQDLGYIQNVKYSSLNSRIIAKIGYEFEEQELEPLKNVLENSPLILDLAVIDHTIDKDPKRPKAKLTIKYAGYITKRFNSPMTDVTAGDKIIERIERQKIINLAQSNNCKPELVQELYDLSRSINKESNKNFRTSIINGLYNRGRIFGTLVYPEIIRQNGKIAGDKIYFKGLFSKAFTDSKPNTFTYTPTNIKKAEVFEEGTDVEKLVNALAGGSDTTGASLAAQKATGDYVYWTTIGDVIDVAMDTIYEFSGVVKNSENVVIRNGSSKSEKMKDIFGLSPLKVITTDVDGINIADYPVSIEFLMNWIQVEIIDQEFDFYPLLGFIKQLTQACITNFASDPELPTIIAVDSDLGRAGHHGGIAAAGTTLDKLISANTMLVQELWQAILKTSKTPARSTLPILNLNNKVSDAIKQKKISPACARIVNEEKKIFEEWQSSASTTYYTTPLIAKNLETKREEYYNIIYCHNYSSKINEKITNMASENDCIANNIPVLRPPLYEYALDESTPDIPPTPQNIAERLRAEGREKEIITETIKGKKKPTEPFKPGIVESIKFSKKDDDYLREARYSSQHFGLFAQLSSVYSAAVNLSVFCSFLTPGMIVYLDADTGDSVFTEGSLSNILGLGGLHIITSVTHKSTFKDNTFLGFKTSFEALYLYRGGDIKVSAKPSKETIKAESESKAILCDGLFDAFNSTRIDTERQQIDGVLSSAQAISVFPSTAAVPNVKKVKEYYNQESIKDTYAQIIFEKNSSKDILKDVEYWFELKLVFSDTWRPDISSPLKAKMYAVMKGDEGAETLLGDVNFVGEFIDG